MKTDFVFTYPDTVDFESCGGALGLPLGGTAIVKAPQHHEIRALVSLRAHGRAPKTLDRALPILARERGLPLRTAEPAEIGFDEHALILVRNSTLATRALERAYAVYPDEPTRHRCRNKWLLHRYCIAEGIASPPTIRTSELHERYVFKRTSGSGNSLVDPFSHLDVICQQRIEGPVVKCYGHLEAARFIGFEEGSGEPVAVPDHISALCRKVLSDFGLCFGGLDFVRGDRWYLIDLNATTGFGRVPLRLALPLLSTGLDLLLSRAAGRVCDRRATA